MNTPKDRLCVVMPVYNEQEAIGPVLRKWDSMLKGIGVDYEIRPYNDGSRDDSLSAMRKVAESLDRVNVRDKPNGGHGNTILTGYRDAATDGFDWIFQVDSDDEMGPEKFGELWSKRDEYDFLVGTRDGRRQAWPRKIISLVSRICVRLFYGKSIWDVNTPYRLMRVSAFRDFYRQIPLTTFAPNVILSGLAARHRLRCLEIPVPQHDRTTGEVSIKKWKLLKAAAKSFWQTIWFAVRHNPVPYVLVFATLAVFLLHIPEMTMSVDTDWHVYALGGRVLDSGGRMYVDFFDHKGPFVFLVHALGCWIWPDYVGTWLIEWLICALALGALWKGVKYRAGTVAAAFAVACFLVIKSAEGCYATPESFAVALTALSIGVVMLGISMVSCCIAGACCAIVFFMKQTLTCPFIAIFLFLVLLPRKRWRALAFFCASFSIVTVGVVAYMWSVGVLPAYWQDCFAFNLLYQNSNAYFANGFSFGALAHSCYDTIRAAGPFVGFAVAGLLAVALKPSLIPDRKAKAVILCWATAFLIDLILVARCGRMFGYKLDPMRFWCALAVLPLIGKCDEIFTSLGRMRKMLLLVLVFVPIFTSSFLGEIARIGLNVQSALETESDVMKTVKWISQLPSDTPIFVWGNNCEIYLKSRRRNVTPYYYWTPLYVDGFLSDEEIDMLMDKFVRERVVVIDKVTGLPGDGIFEHDQLHGTSRFKTRLQKLLSEHYEPRLTLPSGSGAYLPQRSLNAAQFVK